MLTDLLPHPELIKMNLLLTPVTHWTGFMQRIEDLINYLRVINLIRHLNLCVKTQGNLWHSLRRF